MNFRTGFLDYRDAKIGTCQPFVVSNPLGDQLAVPDRLGMRRKLNPRPVARGNAAAQVEIIGFHQSPIP